MSFDFRPFGRTRVPETTCFLGVVSLVFLLCGKFRRAIFNLLAQVDPAEFPGYAPETLFFELFVSFPAVAASAARRGLQSLVFRSAEAFFVLAAPQLLFSIDFLQIFGIPEQLIQGLSCLRECSSGSCSGPLKSVEGNREYRGVNNGLCSLSGLALFVRLWKTSSRTPFTFAVVRPGVSYEDLGSVSSVQRRLLELHNGILPGIEHQSVGCDSR